MNVEMAKILGADLITSVFSPASYDVTSMGFCGRMIEIFPGFRRGMVSFLFMKFSFLLRGSVLRNYDTVIFSNEAISGRVWARGKKVYYAHSISRHLFDQRDQYIKKVSFWLRPLFRGALFLLKWWYLFDLRSMDLILANSKKNADFLRALAP